MRQSSKNKRPSALPDSVDPTISGDLPKSAQADYTSPTGEHPLPENISQDDVGWLQLVADNAPVNIAYLDTEHRYRFVNGNVERHYGLRREEIIGKHALEIMDEDVYRYFLPHIEAALRGQEVTFERNTTLFDEQQRNYQYTYHPHFAEHDKVAGFYVVVVDITDRKRAEAELQRNVRESELLRRIAVLANEAATTDDAIQMCLDEVCAYIGWPLGHAYMPAADGTGELETTNLWHIDDPERYEDLRRITKEIHYAYEQSLPSRVLAKAAPQWMLSDTTYRHQPRTNERIEASLKSGFAFPAMASKTVVAVLEFFSPEAIEPDPQFLNVTEEIGILVGQVIERKQAEGALGDSEAHLAHAQRIANIGSWTWVASTEELYWSDALFKLLQMDRSGADERRTQFSDMVHPDDRHEFFDLKDLLSRSEKVETGDYRVTLPDGTEHIFHSEWEYERDKAGSTVRVVGITQDVTQARQSEMALRESEQWLRSVVDNVPATLTLKNPDGTFRYVNKQFCEWYDLRPEQVVGKIGHDIFPDDTADTVDAMDREIFETGEAIQAEVPATFADGSKHTLLTNKFLVHGDDGAVLGNGLVGYDVTDAKRTEEMLRQAQKMEAVGQLTGGVAHDFNNLLAVVIGNLEMVADHLHPDTPAFDFVRNAFNAAERGASLTHHLLAFARQQVLRPEETDLAKLIGETRDLMSVSMGEKITVKLETDDDLWRCKADQAQLQNAILNLSINARDAMPTGGNVTISAENTPLDAERAEALELEAGDYVCLSVSDTGPGIPEDVLEHVYEPFYTTKDVGEGSGLGLSMVYGFAQQSGGAVDIETEVGEGTTINLYFPAVVSEAVTAIEDVTQPQADLLEPDATILLVEDNAAFREVTRTILESLNFRVIDFGSAEEALSVIGDTTPFDLLLSDIGLPGEMNGHDLAGYATSARPGLKTVLMSAHADIKLDGGIIDHNVAAFLRKPHRKTELAQTLRRVLGLDILAT